MSEALIRIAPTWMDDPGRQLDLVVYLSDSKHNQDTYLARERVNDYVEVHPNGHWTKKNAPGYDKTQHALIVTSADLTGKADSVIEYDPQIKRYKTMRARKESLDISKISIVDGKADVFPSVIAANSKVNDIEVVLSIG